MEEEIITKKAIIIGGSAGSLQPIFALVRSLPEGFMPAIIIVIHRLDEPHSSLCNLLAHYTALPVSEAEDKQRIQAGHIYIAPAGYHLLMEMDRSFSLDCSEKVNFSRPSIDVSFQSAADTFKDDLTAILLSGANEDGTFGCKAIKRNNGLVIVQNPKDAESSVMPQSVINSGYFDHVASLESFSKLLDIF